MVIERVGRLENGNGSIMSDGLLNDEDDRVKCFDQLWWMLTVNRPPEFGVQGSHTSGIWMWSLILMALVNGKFSLCRFLARLWPLELTQC